MLRLDPPIRLAEETDAAELAELVNFAGEGLPYYLWQQLAARGQDPWTIGRERQAAKAREGQIYVVDYGAGPVAGLTGYVIGPEPSLIGADMPAMFRLLQELENTVPDSWYVNVLACYPRFRGTGIGTKLLELAEDLARDAGLHRMSVIVSDDNEGARRLYERTGYAEIDRRPCVREGWVCAVQEWVLLTKPL